jgi:16S rRNA processing protein RimM
VSVTPTTDEPERRFAVGAAVLLDEQVRTVLDARPAGRLTILLSGCASRDDAEELRGRWLYVEADEEPPADENEFYDHQLEGLNVTVAGAVVGRVTEVLHLPGQDVLSVALTAGGSALIPFVAEMVPEVDVVAGHVRVEPVEGLLDAD